MRGLRSLCLIVFISLFWIHCSMAQNPSFEFWPETDIWYTLSPAWRLSAFVPITKYNESGDCDLNVYLQADYRWGHTKYSVFKRMMDENKAGQIKAWMVRSGFMEGWSLGENAGEYTEDMLFMELHKRIPLKRSGMLISSRIRNDFRWVGEDPVFSYRFRFRFMIERGVYCRTHFNCSLLECRTLLGLPLYHIQPRPADCWDHCIIGPAFCL